MSAARSSDRGAALVEFTWLAVLLLVPLIYLVLTVFEIQRAAYGVTAAAREGGRLYVTAPSGAAAEVRARAAVDQTLRDHGLDPEQFTTSVTCAARPCLTPGATLAVRVSGTVRLPWVPDVLGESVASVSVEARHDAVVDPYRATRP